MGISTDPQLEEQARFVVAVIAKLYEQQPTEQAAGWRWLFTGEQRLKGRLPIDMILAGRGTEVLDLFDNPEPVKQPFDWRGPFPTRARDADPPRPTGRPIVKVPAAPFSPAIAGTPG